MALTKAKQFEVSFIAAITGATEADDKWFTLALEAPEVFGKQCYDNGTDDYQAMRDTCMAAYAATQGGMPAKPERADKSAKANEARELRRRITTTASVYIGRMAGYFAKANDIEREAKPLTLDKAIGRIATLVKGRAAKGKKPAIKPIAVFPAWFVAEVDKLIASGTKTKNTGNVVNAAHRFAPTKQVKRQRKAA